MKKPFGGEEGSESTFEVEAGSQAAGCWVGRKRTHFSRVQEVT